MHECEVCGQMCDCDGEVAIYDDEAGDSFPRSLCDACANEAEECGVRMKSARKPAIGIVDEETGEPGLYR